MNSKLDVNLAIKKERDARKESLKDYQLQKKFGITLAKYAEMHKEQNGVCLICSQPERTPNRNLAVDHCHTTGKVRGLLCGHCNKGIGHFYDRIDLLNKSIEYLEKYAGN
ncbi:MAG: recombination endonuclease VII [Podoviridae sp. ctbj_2]|nr:MAG: recombination endonuclease VII [Podoviridae sp. ctbj_2]